MIDRIIDFFYRLGGYRKLGANLTSKAPDGRRYTDTPIKFKKTDRSKIEDYIDLSGAHEVTQGRTGSCVCCTLVALVIDQVIAKKKDKMFWIDWNPIWEHMKELGIADDKGGSSLLDNLWYFQTYGYEGNDGKRYFPEKIHKISRNDIELALHNGHQVFSGANCGDPLCDKNWVFIPRQRDYGHGFRIMGKNPLFLIAETTWNNYGYKRESQFFLSPKDRKYLFSCYILEVKV